MIDIGANLGHESFCDDLNQVVSDAKEAGIEHIVVTGTSVEGSQKAHDLALKFPSYLYSTAGIHPHDAAEFSSTSIDDLRTLASQSNVIAIGETGLDFNRNYSPQDAQKIAFAAQLDLAIELQKPLFLHQRDAHEQFMSILAPRLNSLSKVVVHCFTGSREELEDYISHDFYIGITGWVCDERRGHHLHELLPLIPPERLMIETDSPYLLPRTIKPKPKSRRNEPANLIWVAKTVADCLGMDETALRQNTNKVAKQFFSLPTEPKS